MIGGEIPLSSFVTRANIHSLIRYIAINTRTNGTNSTKIIELLVLTAHRRGQNEWPRISIFAPYNRNKNFKKFRKNLKKK